MSEMTLIKLPNNLFQPATPIDAAKAGRFKTGDCMTLIYKQKRNSAFFRKWWSLINFAFEQWEPVTGLPEKNFERFRKDMTIAAGFYTLVPCINGELKAEAQSISFAAMDEDTFADLYDATVEAVRKFVLKNYSRADIDEVIRQLLEYC